MKAFITGLVIVIVLGVAGFMGFRYLSRQTPPASDSSQSLTATLTGTLMAGKGDDYSFVLRDAKGKTTGVTSQTIQLDKYANKKVEVTGSYSGTTLYVYTLIEQ